eukprot:jgi/Psemu1/46789/gm1.46789_g
MPALSQSLSLLLSVSAETSSPVSGSRFEPPPWNKLLWLELGLELELELLLITHGILLLPKPCLRGVIPAQGTGVRLQLQQIAGEAHDQPAAAIAQESISCSIRAVFAGGIVPTKKQRMSGLDSVAADATLVSLTPESNSGG